MSPPDTANRVRDHLANERTYLAWIRTAVALMGFGVLIVRMRYLVPAEVRRPAWGWELGLLFTVVGLLAVVLSTSQYFAVRNAIESATYEPSGRWVVILSAAIALIGVGVLYWLLATAPPNLRGKATSNALLPERMTLIFEERAAAHPER